MLIIWTTQKKVASQTRRVHQYFAFIYDSWYKHIISGKFLTIYTACFAYWKTFHSKTFVTSKMSLVKHVARILNHLKQRVKIAINLKIYLQELKRLTPNHFSYGHKTINLVLLSKIIYSLTICFCRNWNLIFKLKQTQNRCTSSKIAININTFSLE